MRKADLDAAWIGCRRQPIAQINLSTLEINGDELGPSVSIASRVSALIGNNGTGKTGLLGAIHSALSGESSPAARRFDATVTGAYRGRPFSARSNGGDGVDGLNVVSIDASARCHAILNFINSQDGFDELVEQAGIEDVPKAELDRLRHAIGRNYSAVRFCEIELPIAASNLDEATTDIEPEVFPFFQIETGKISYDVRAMGFGELCSFYLIWRLWRIAKGSVVLLDEPDSHLSPRARKALIDLFALVAHERQLAIVFSSHFTEPVAVLREEELVLIQQDETNANSSITLANTKRLAVRQLGISPSRRLLLIVEDLDAQEVVRQIVNRWGATYATTIDIQVAGGATDISRLLELFPITPVCRLSAILDGDKRGEYAGREGILFLPGNSDPIQCGRDSLVGREGLLADNLGVSHQLLLDALTRVRHVDHHDFCAALVQELELQGRQAATVREALIRVWLLTPVTAVEAEILSGRLAELVNQIPLDH